MGVTIQFESHSNELAAILDYENDPDCLEFYDQPQPSIPLEYRAKNGRQLRVLHTADFFVLRAEWAGWVECKTEQDLINLAEQSPGRFQKAADGTWHCRPGEDYASRFGLRYHLRSSRETDLVYRRNLEFLEDYMRCGTLMIPEGVQVAVRAAVRARPGITVAELLQVTNPFGPDDIYGLIAAADLYVDLHAVPLTDAAQVPVFCTMADAQAHSMVTRLSPPATTDRNPFVSLSVGQAVLWDGKRWEIVNVGSSKTSLMATDGSLVQMPHSTFEELVRSGGITGIAQARDGLTKTWDRIESASPRQLQEATRRYGIIRPYLEGEPVRGNVAPLRTIYDWLKKYRVVSGKSICIDLQGISDRTAVQ
jgi:putative transposase